MPGVLIKAEKPSCHRNKKMVAAEDARVPGQSKALVPQGAKKEEDDFINALKDALNGVSNNVALEVRLSAQSPEKLMAYCREMAAIAAMERIRPQVNESAHHFRQAVCAAENPLVEGPALDRMTGGILARMAEADEARYARPPIDSKAVADKMLPGMFDDFCAIDSSIIYCMLVAQACLKVPKKHPTGEKTYSRFSFDDPSLAQDSGVQAESLWEGDSPAITISGKDTSGAGVKNLREYIAEAAKRVPSCVERNAPGYKRRRGNASA